MAHGKIICRADYDKAVELADMFEKMFGECIDIIDTFQINNEQAEAVEAVAQQMISRHSENELEENNIFNNEIGINNSGA